LNQLSLRRFRKRVEYHMLSRMTKVILIQRTGGPEVLMLDSVELRPPGPGEVRVQHAAIGVNYIDTYHRSGLYAIPLPAVLGVEASGTVAAVGPGVELAPGTRVAYATAGTGAYAEARLLPADRVVPLPTTIGDELAAASLLKGMTAEMLVHRLVQLREGDVAVVHAAAGGVGSILTQWLKHLGIRAIGIVGSEQKAELARQNGCETVLVAGKDDLVQRVRALTDGRGARVVYDSVGKTTLPSSLDMAMARGLVVSFGNASGKADPVDPLTLGAKGCLFLTRPILNEYTKTPEELRASASALFDLLGSGAVKVRIGQRYPLADAAQAHRALEGRHTTGSTLLVP
jgi:NADPH2:quinone reductase